MRDVPDVLIIGDTMRVPELRHEVPLGIGDPFLYAEKDGARYVFASSLEMPRLRELDGLETIPNEEVGQDELLRQGMPRDQIMLELAVRSCRRIELSDALVPRFFPLAFADRLRSEGIKLTPDRDFFNARRRVKSPAELDGIRRAQKAAEAGMAAAGELLGRASANGGGLEVDGKPLTSEWIKAVIGSVFVANGCASDEFIVSHGAQTAIGHEGGHGQIQPNEPIVIDLWPRDTESACYADMTRTFVVGEPSDELQEWQRLCQQALDEAIAKIGPGVKGVEIFRGTCELFEEHGYPTQLTKEPGTVLDEGFFHGLGHGVGLDVHEDPNLGIAGDYELVAGDVITVEPGLYRPGIGGCRLEDLVLVTDDGAENLTVFPYDLAP
jgi:Xaa-Pro aminopeptidase